MNGITKNIHTRFSIITTNMHMDRIMIIRIMMIYSIAPTFTNSRKQYIEAGNGDFDTLNRNSPANDNACGTGKRNRPCAYGHSVGKGQSSAAQSHAEQIGSHSHDGAPYSDHCTGCRTDYSAYHGSQCYLTDQFPAARTVVVCNYSVYYTTDYRSGNQSDQECHEEERPRRIYVHHRIVPAIGVEIEAVYCFGIKVFYAINGDKTTGFGIVVARLEVIQPCFFVVEVTAIAERIENADMVRIGNIISVCSQHRMVAPCIVHISYHNIAVTVKKDIEFSPGRRINLSDFSHGSETFRKFIKIALFRE